METSIILVGLGLLVLAVGPVLWLNYRANTRVSNLKKTLKRVETESGLSFIRTEFRYNKAFGLDTQKGVLLQLNLDQGKENLEVVALDEVKECRFNLLPDVKDQDQIDEVSELIFIMHQPWGTQKTISFYDPKRDNYIDLKPIQITTRDWQKLISGYLVQASKNRPETLVRSLKPRHVQRKLNKAG